MGEYNKKIKPTEENNIIVCSGEPLIKFLSSFNIPPYRFGLYFFIVISFTLSLAGASCKPNPHQNNFHCYFENISWSLSILFIFPFIVGLTSKYYQKIQLLLNGLTEVPSQEKMAQAKGFIRKINCLFNNYYAPVIILIITIGFNIVYYEQILNDVSHKNWITNGNFLQNILNTASGFTYPGFYSAIIQIFLIYWIFNIVWNSSVFLWGLHKIFNEDIFENNINPLHADGCSGLEEIGNTYLILYYIYLLLGAYLFLKVIDKAKFQNLPLTVDIGNPAFLVCYFAILPFILFVPFYVVHSRMKQVKLNLINKFKHKYAELIGFICANENNCKYEDINNLKILMNSLEHSITVWPFKFKSMRFIFKVILPPVLTAASTLLVKYLLKI